jgi:cyanophycin synthetase
MLLTRAYGSAYLSEYRQLFARFEQRPKTVLNEIWADAAGKVGATITGDWDSGFEFTRADAHARVDGWETHLDPPELVRRALDKPQVVSRLAAAGVAVPDQISFSRRQIGQVAAHVRRDGGRWVLKPRAGDSGVGVTCGIESSKDLARGFVAAAPLGDALVLERQVTGSVYRFLFLDNELLAVVRRDPTSVEGDGTATIRRLLRAENHARVDAAGARGNQLVQPDHDCLLALRAQSLSLASVPAAGVRLRIKYSNGDGGRLDTHTVPRSSVAQEVVDEATRAVDAVGLRLAGVDVVTPDLSRGITEAGGAIVDVNAPPGLHYHYLTADGDPAGRVATRILHALLET